MSSFSRCSAISALFFAIAVYQPTKADAANTWLCNASSETLYVSVRHYAASIFASNARTEGWRAIPTRGIFRSCWILNRSNRDHIVVIGVLRNSQVTPIIIRPRRVDARRQVDVCVPVSTASVEYRSNNRSDRSCGADYQLARASFSVEGGSNDVDIDLR